jgi:hypothetical protein
MSRGLALELLLSLLNAAGGYAAAFVPLALRRVLAAVLGWDPHPTLVWLLGSAIAGLLTISVLSIERRQSRLAHLTAIRVIGDILFAVPALPLGFICLIMMAPHGILMLPHIWPFLCSLAISSVLGFFILQRCMRYGVS